MILEKAEAIDRIKKYSEAFINNEKVFCEHCNKDVNIQIDMNYVLIDVDRGVSFEDVFCSECANVI